MTEAETETEKWKLTVAESHQILQTPSAAACAHCLHVQFDKDGRNHFPDLDVCFAVGDAIVLL